MKNARIMEPKVWCIFSTAIVMQIHYGKVFIHMLFPLQILYSHPSNWHHPISITLNIPDIDTNIEMPQWMKRNHSCSKLGGTTLCVLVYLTVHRIHGVVCDLPVLMSPLQRLSVAWHSAIQWQLLLCSYQLVMQQFPLWAKGCWGYLSLECPGKPDLVPT